MQETTRLRDAPVSSWSAVMGTTPSPRYELRYRPLAQVGRGFAFPCDEGGRVPMDQLSPHSLDNYLYARAVVGHELQWPQVRRVA